MKSRSIFFIRSHVTSSLLRTTNMNRRKGSEINLITERGGRRKNRLIQPKSTGSDEHRSIFQLIWLMRNERRKKFISDSERNFNKAPDAIIVRMSFMGWEIKVTILFDFITVIFAQ